MNAVTETMNIQLRQTKFTYWRKSNVRSGGPASIFSLEILYPMFIDWHPLWASDAGTAILLRQHLVARRPCRQHAGSAADLFLKQGRSGGRSHTRQCQFRSD